MEAESQPRSASKSVAVVGLINIASMSIGVVQAFVIGWQFGTQVQIEVFFAVASIYLAIVKLMQTGQLTELFTPIYHELRETQSQAIAHRLVSILLNWLVLIAAGVAGTAYLLADRLVPWFVPGFKDDRLSLSIEMFRWLLPLVGVHIVHTFLGNVLAAEKRFASQEICRFVGAASGLTCILLLASRLDAWAMVAAYWANNILLMVCLIWLVRSSGYRHRFCFSDSRIPLRNVIKTVPSIIGYVSVTQLYQIAFTAGLSVLPQGSLAMFTYAKRIFSRINSVLASPISVVFFNHYSEEVAKKSSETASLIRQTLRISLMASTFASIIVIASGLPGMRALWLSDRFPESYIVITYQVLCVICASALLIGPEMIYRKINVSHHQVDKQYRLLCIGQAVCGLLSYFLIPVWGLAVAVFIACINPGLMAVSSAFLFRERERVWPPLYSRRDLAKCSLVFLASVVPVILAQFYLGASTDRIENGLIAFASIAVSLVIGIVVSAKLGLHEVRLAIIAIGQKLQKKYRAIAGNS